MSVLPLHSVSIMHFQNSWLASSPSEHICTGSPLKLSAPMSSITTPCGPVSSLFLAQPCTHSLSSYLCSCNLPCLELPLPSQSLLSLVSVILQWSLSSLNSSAHSPVTGSGSCILSNCSTLSIVPSINLTQICIKHWLWQVPWQTLKIKKQGRITRWFYLLGKTHTKVFTEMRHLCRDAPIILKSEMRVLTSLNAPRSEDSWGLLYILQCLAWCLITS